MSNKDQIGNHPDIIKKQAVAALKKAKELEAKQKAAGRKYQAGPLRSRILTKSS